MTVRKVCACVGCQVARGKAKEDAMIFGTGFLRRHLDGHVEHVPANEIEIW